MADNFVCVRHIPLLFSCPFNSLFFYIYIFNPFTSLSVDRRSPFVRYNSSWVYDGGSDDEVPFTPADSDVLVADVDFDADTVAALSGTDQYYQHMTKGYSSGDLTFYANKYGSSSTDSTGDFHITGSYFIAQSIDTVSYPSVFATSLTEPAVYSQSSSQTLDYYQYKEEGAPEIHMKIYSYYTGADSTMWKVFDGDFSSSTSVQEPDLLLENALFEVRIHSVPWSSEGKET